MTAKAQAILAGALALLALGAPGCRGAGEAHDEHAGEHRDHEEEAGHADHDSHGGEEHDRHDEHEEGVVELSAEALAHAGIRTEVAAHHRLEGLIETTGQIGFDEDRLVHVSPRIPGRVHEVNVSLGQAVEAREVLAVIDSIELGQAKAAYLQARAREEVTRESLEREQSLRAERITSEKEVALARAEHREAEAALRSAVETLRLYGIDEGALRAVRYDDPDSSLLAVRAALPGKVVEKHVTVGELVDPEDELFVLADLSSVWIWIDVYERHVANVHTGDGAQVLVDAAPGKGFEGVVAYVRDQVDEQTRTVRARVDVGNADGALRPGMFARVILADPHAVAERPERLAVPAAAIQREEEGSVAFVEVGERRFEKRAVTTGIKGGPLVEVVEGIRAGERVVVDGAFVLRSEASKESMGGGHSH